MKTKIGKLVGRIDNEYYICDTLFEHADDFKGATATVLCPVAREDYEDRTNPNGDYAKDYFEDCWREAVQVGNTTGSLANYAKMILAINGDEAIFDFSGYDYWELLREAAPELTEEDYPVFECAGGGRSFRPDMEWDEIYDKELWEQIKRIESK